MAIPTYHATTADVESEQTLLTKAPAHPWKRLAAGAAVASFVLGCLAATAPSGTRRLRRPSTLLFLPARDPTSPRPLSNNLHQF